MRFWKAYAIALGFVVLCGAAVTFPNQLLFQASGSTLTRKMGDKLGDVISVKDPHGSTPGAVGDGVTDDTTSIQAAITAALVSGADLLIPPGYYKVTSTLNVGLAEWDQYDFIMNRTAEATDTLFNTHAQNANITANYSKPAISIIFANGAFLVASWSPGAATPVLAYNLRNGTNATGGSIINANIIGTASFSGGVYVQPSSSALASNNLIGLYAAQGARVIERPFFSSLQHGLVSARAYWTQIRGTRCENGAGDCLNIALGNALNVSNTVALNAGRGVVFDGSASTIDGIHTEQVAQDLTIFLADACRFGPGYFEDVSATDGTGLYSITLGYVNNGLKVTSSIFSGLSVYSVRPNKKALRIWDTFTSSFIGSRVNGLGIDADTSSQGVWIGGDFTTFSSGGTFGNWLKLGESTSEIKVHEGGNGYVIVDSANARKWQMYKVSAADANLYVRDVVNSRMQATYLPGTSDKNATTTLASKLTINARFAGARVTPSYGASVGIDATLGNEYVITATNGTAFTIANPTGAATGQRITIRVRNTSGGALGVVTWDTLYKITGGSTWSFPPATGQSRSVDFQYDGTNWIMVDRSDADVPN